MTAKTIISLYNDVGQKLVIEAPENLEQTETILTFPVSSGDPGQILTTDGSGTLSWQNASAAGSVGDVNPLNETESTLIGRGEGLGAGNSQEITFGSGLSMVGTVLSATAAGGVSTVFARSGDVVAVDGDYTAAQITNVPAGTITTADVQAALNQLDTNKQALITLVQGFIAGRGAASGTGSPEAITVGSHLVLSGTTLSATDQSTFDAIVAPAGGDFTTVADAVDAGRKNILIDGNVTETRPPLLTASVTQLTQSASGNWDLGDNNVQVIAKGAGLTTALDGQLTFSPTTSKSTFGTKNYPFTGDITNGSPVITNLSVDTSTLRLGQSVIAGSDINDTTILSIDSSSQITVADNAFNTVVGASFNSNPLGGGNITMRSLQLFGLGGTADDCHLYSGFSAAILSGTIQQYVPNQHGWGIHQGDSNLTFQNALVAVVALSGVGTNCYNHYSGSGVVNGIVLVGSFHPTNNIISPASGTIQQLSFLAVAGPQTINVGIGGELNGYFDALGGSPLNIQFLSDGADLTGVDTTGTVDVNGKQNVDLINCTVDSILNRNSTTHLLSTTETGDTLPKIQNIDFFYPGYTAPTDALTPQLLLGTETATNAYEKIESAPLVWTVADQTARLALSTARVGDLAVQQDTSPFVPYQLTALPSSTSGNWTQVGASGGGGSAVYETFVFKPGATPSGNLYTSWSLLYTDLTASSGQRSIVFDDSLGAITIPSGTWDMTNVRWTADFRGATNTVAVAVGASTTFPGLKFIEHVHINYASTTTAVLFTSPVFIYLGHLAQISCSSTGRFFELGAGTTNTYIWCEFAQIVSSNPFLQKTTSTTTVIVAINSTIGSNQVAGTNGILLISQDPVSSVNSQTGTFTGTYAAQLTYLAANVAFTANGDISSVTVQNAIVEVRNDTDTKLAVKVTGPASATDSAIALFDGTTGKLIKDSGIPISSIGATTSLVFRPGGTQSQNVYNDWNALIAALALAQGDRTILFDGTAGTLEVPAGTYDMEGVRWQGLLDFATAITVDDGVTLTNLTQISDCAVNYNSSANCVIYPNNQAGIRLINSSIACSGSGVFLDVTSSPGPYLFLYVSSLDGSTPAVSVGASSLLNLYLLDSSIVNANTILGDPTATLTPFLDSGSILDSQTGTFAGTITPTSFFDNFNAMAGEIVTSQITNANVTLAKIQNATANSKLLGSGATGSGASYSELTLGTNLSITGTVLNASGGGTTNLGYTASPTNGTVTSSTGTSATLPLGDTTNAGLLAPADKTKLNATSGTNSGDQTITLTSDVTGTGTGSFATTIASNAVTTAKINNSAVTLAKIANAAANSRLLGSGAAGSGAAYSELTLGTNLSMSGTVLNASGGGGGGDASTNVSSSVDMTLARFSGTTGKLLTSSSVLLSNNNELSQYNYLIAIKTTNYTLAVIDNAAFLDFNITAASTLTLPQTSTLALPAGYAVNIQNLGSAVLTIATQGSDTVAGNLTLRPFDAATIIKVSAGSPNVWTVVGGHNPQFFELDKFDPSTKTANTTYNMSVKMPFSGILNTCSVTVGTNTPTGGGCTFRAAINGTPCGTAGSNIGASGTPVTATYTTANTISASDVITIAITIPTLSSLTSIDMQINGESYS